MSTHPEGASLRRLLTVACLLLLAGCTVPERYIFTTDNHLDFTDLGPELRVQEVLFPEADRRLYGWYVPGEPGRPLVLYFQGNASNLSHRIENLVLLREKLEVSIFIFDYRGFGWSLGDPSVAGLLEDARSALAHLREQGWSPERMVYFGHSLGAAVALQLALESPPAGLVMEAPFTSLSDLVGYHHPWTSLWFPLIFPEAYNNLKKMERVRTPLLLLHGDADRVSPAAMSKALYARALAPKRLHIIAGGDHDGNFRSGESYWQPWRQFLQQLDHLPKSSKHPLFPPSSTN
jgi:uncharacterized protein